MVKTKKRLQYKDVVMLNGDHPKYKRYIEQEFNNIAKAKAAVGACPLCGKYDLIDVIHDLTSSHKTLVCIGMEQSCNKQGHNKIVFRHKAIFREAPTKRNPNTEWKYVGDENIVKF